MTLTLDRASAAWFDALRSRHFPPDRLVVGAHVTMFHALPAACEPAVALHMARLCAPATRFGVDIAGTRFLGHGVAFALTAPPALALRAELAKEVGIGLTAQDRARWSPHVTVQNKVSAEQARATLALLSGHAPPAPIEAVGLALWRYRGGPWEAVQAWDFAGRASPQDATRP